MTVTARLRPPVNASPAPRHSKFKRYYSPAPIRDGERAALLQWAHCYWHPDALTAYAETDGWEGCADLVLRNGAVLRHVIWIGIHVRRRSCREAAEDFAEIAVRNGIWRARYISLAQTFSEDIGRWAPEYGSLVLTAIWREARAEQDDRDTREAPGVSRRFCQLDRRGFK
jgi:hypothetical protein